MKTHLITLIEHLLTSVLLRWRAITNIKLHLKPAIGIGTISLMHWGSGTQAWSTIASQTLNFVLRAPPVIPQLSYSGVWTNAVLRVHLNSFLALHWRVKSTVTKCRHCQNFGFNPGPSRELLVSSSKAIQQPFLYLACNHTCFCHDWPSTDGLSRRRTNSFLRDTEKNSLRTTAVRLTSY